MAVTRLMQIINSTDEHFFSVMIKVNTISDASICHRSNALRRVGKLAAFPTETEYALGLTPLTHQRQRKFTGTKYDLP